MSEYRGSRKRNAMKALLEDQQWACSVCTFVNSPEAFKCLMCDVRKGTSTRKPKLSSNIVAQQESARLVAQSPHLISPSLHGETTSTDTSSSTSSSASSDDDNASPVRSVKSSEVVKKPTLKSTELQQRKSSKSASNAKSENSKSPSSPNSAPAGSQDKSASNTKPNQKASSNKQQRSKVTGGGKPSKEKDEANPMLLEVTWNNVTVVFKEYRGLN